MLGDGSTNVPLRYWQAGWNGRMWGVLAVASIARGEK